MGTQPSVGFAPYGSPCGPYPNGGGWKFTDYIDSNSLTIRIPEFASSGSPPRPEAVTGGNGTCTVSVSPDPTYPCRAVAFGTPCFADLALGTDFTIPGSSRAVLTALAAPAPGVWVLSLGDQEANMPLPIGSGTIYDNLVVVLPMTSTSLTTASLLLTPPPIPNLSLVVQGATWNGLAVNLSSGFEMFCN